MMRQTLLSSFLSIATANLFITSTVTAEEFPIIARLLVREGMILVSQDHQGQPRYSLMNHDGKQIETKISEAQLAAKYSDIYDRFRPAVADKKESPWAGTFID